MSQQPKVVSSTNIVDPKNTHFVYMKLLKYTDAEGKERPWEVAERKNRSEAGIDAVAIVPIIRSATNKFKPSTVIVEQFRPPMDAFVLEFPAGLVDKGESPKQAALRELYEETGYNVRGGKVVDGPFAKPQDAQARADDAKALEEDGSLHITSVLGADPGMTTANLKLVTVDVELPDELVEHPQNLDQGEFITRRTVPIDDLARLVDEYVQKGFVIDAKLAFWVEGYEMAKKFKATA